MYLLITLCMANSMAPTDFKRKTYKPPLLLTKNLAIIDTHCIHSSDLTYSPTAYNLWNGWLVGDILHIYWQTHEMLQSILRFLPEIRFLDSSFLSSSFYIAVSLSLHSATKLGMNSVDQNLWFKPQIKLNINETQWFCFIPLFLTLGHLWWFS